MAGDGDPVLGFINKTIVVGLAVNDGITWRKRGRDLACGPINQRDRVCPCSAILNLWIENLGPVNDGLRIVAVREGPPTKNRSPTAMVAES
ncbi:MAG: hypothetical protein ACI9TH_001766 [Kiritimatiellia bacterium]|jgi:hypothetical protein